MKQGQNTEQKGSVLGNKSEETSCVCKCCTDVQTLQYLKTTAAGYKQINGPMVSVFLFILFVGVSAQSQELAPEIQVQVNGFLSSGIGDDHVTLENLAFKEARRYLLTGTKPVLTVHAKEDKADIRKR